MAGDEQHVACGRKPRRQARAVLKDLVRDVFDIELNRLGI
jgi:hypothetical protein